MRKIPLPHNTALVHNHWNDSPGSQADFDAALWLGVRYLIVVTPSGMQYIYERDGDTMKLLDEIFNREHVALPTAEETAESREAYEAQMLAEAGNPAERVMRQEEPHWWQRENVIVPYNTTETVEQVAARMGIPAEHLEQINEGNKEKDVMYIPLPGRYVDNWYRYGIVQSHNRTLLGPVDSVRQWQELSPTEQKIEMALTATANAIPGRANFDNIQSFASALGWIADNNKLIEKYANNAGISEEMLEIGLTSEIFYDYGFIDNWQDVAVRDWNWVFTQRDAWNSTGVSNAHFVTLIEAYRHISSQLPPGAEHPWDLDPNAPDLSAFPYIDSSEDDIKEQVEKYAQEFYEQQERWPGSFERLEPGQQETMRFIVLERLYAKELDYDLHMYPISRYLATNEGSINAASIVLNMYQSQYITENEEYLQNVANGAETLSPVDMARIWGRYRSSFELFETYRAVDGEMGPNAHLALPIAEHFLNEG